MVQAKRSQHKSQFTIAFAFQPLRRDLAKFFIYFLGVSGERIVFAYYDSGAPCFIRCRAHQFHLATGKREAVEVEYRFLADLYVCKTFLPKRVQRRRRNLIRTDRSHHGTRKIVYEPARLLLRAYGIARDQRYSGADLIGEKSI